MSNACLTDFIPLNVNEKSEHTMRGSLQEFGGYDLVNQFRAYLYIISLELHKYGTELYRVNTELIQSRWQRIQRKDGERN